MYFKGIPSRPGMARHGCNWGGRLPIFPLQAFLKLVWLSRFRQQGLRIILELLMSLISPDKVTDSVHREWSKTRVTSQANLIASPLYKSLDVLACPRAYTNLTLGRGQVRIRLKWLSSSLNVMAQQDAKESSNMSSTRRWAASLLGKALHYPRRTRWSRQEWSLGRQLLPYWSIKSRKKPCQLISFTFVPHLSGQDPCMTKVSVSAVPKHAI